jgi:hypothetical protein
MKKLSTLALILLSILTIVSCNSHQESHSDGISLNNGEKWMVNAEMKPHIQEGKVILEAYQADGGSDYKALAEQLEAANADLIKSCTMDGESHNQLHNWLLPHMKLITKLKESTSQSEAKQAIAELEESFETYEKYFK